MFTVHGMEVWRRVISEEQLDDDSVESGNFRHIAISVKLAVTGYKKPLASLGSSANIAAENPRVNLLSFLCWSNHAREDAIAIDSYAQLE